MRKIDQGILLGLSALCLILLVSLVQSNTALNDVKLRALSSDQQLNLSQASLTQLRGEMGSLRNQVTELQTAVNQYRVTGVFLKRPSQDELRSFLERDKVDETPYSEDNYLCMQYSRDLKQHAAMAGFNFSVVLINFKAQRIGETEMNAYGHVVCGTFLSNGNFVYVEPQSDAVTSDLVSELKLFFGVDQLETSSVVVIW